ncbi:probable ADP-ribosylation factor GTPase-activating protein AGD14 isoform X1 [Typha angustifolia]|uniref:probable ADP-ribosylation factor GTPase-activating protein AGD14 isoform X1 n=1 Tax=Typha angustifolia TaxID=59011 RepID=UPI003C2FB75A
MSSKKEEERNEKIIRGLLKLPPNRKCINCNSLGPQYVCTSFWTFICITCSGVHREFTHRVKSVSMAKFTTQEVESLQRGGNQRAKEIFLKDWDPQKMRFPDSSNINQIREFISSVYVDKKYNGGRSSEKPPRDMQSHKNLEEHRRASSYHSYSQSPPYDYQYEERCHGKQTGQLSRKPGSDRGHYEMKVSSFPGSPGSLQEHMYNDRFANEIYGSRNSDFSVSSTGDPFRSDGQSPNFQDTAYASPPLQQGRDILIDNARPQTLNSESNGKRNLNEVCPTQRTASSSSVGSMDSASAKSTNSASLMDIVLGPEHASGAQRNHDVVSPSFSELPITADAINQDFFNPLSVQQPIIHPDPPVDFSADANCQPSSTPEENASAAPFFENVGWATFDLPPRSFSGENNIFPSSDTVPVGSDLFSSVRDNSLWVSASVIHGPLAVQSHIDSDKVKGSANLTSAESWSAFDDTSVCIPPAFSQISSASHEAKRSADSSQSWEAFDDTGGNIPQIYSWTLTKASEPQEFLDKPLTANNPFAGTLTKASEPQDFLDKPLTANNPFASFLISNVSTKDGFQEPFVGEFGAFDIPFDIIAESIPSSAVPLMVESTGGQKPTNPFDLPFGLEQKDNNMFMDMNSLREALPGPQFPADLFSSLSQTLFPQNSATSCIPSLHQGELPYQAGQVLSSQLPSIISASPVASLGGNPFA